MLTKKILIINTTFDKGGAAKIARHVFKYVSEDESFDTYFAYSMGPKESIKTFKFGFMLERYIHASLVRFIGIEGYGSYFSTKKLINFIKNEKFDLIHIHNLHGYYLNFFTLINFLNKYNIPVVWTLHDEWSMTWLPAHSMGCQHCKTLEGVCINQYQYPKTYNKLFAKFMLNKKANLFSNKYNLTIVYLLDWMRESVANSYLKHLRSKLIPNGVDINTFKPLDNKEELRRKYGIPLDKKVVLFSISNIKDVNKGYQSILETTKILRDEDILFVGVGDLNIKNSKNNKTIQYISDESLMAEVYNLADVFLYTSLVESCPMTIIESMACGVPVVAFEAQGVQELVDKDSGFLSKTGDVLELANNVEFLLDNKELRENMSISGRRKIVESFSLERMLVEYNKLYKNILNI